MGSVRPGFIKNAARSLMQLYPDTFTDDFETNKRLVEQLTDIETKKVRNRVAGYLVRLVRIRLAREESEAEEAAAEEPITDTEM
ncbi:MAG: 30S ribosomal protein S17e [Candidatus Thorarchaeota archaeon SMTZ1-83]|nr:MAG: 30S ribosomal protein S17e [Candidatus Thorarchaeota archaeon SMTZ1-83]